MDDWARGTANFAVINFFENIWDMDELISHVNHHRLIKSLKSVYVKCFTCTHHQS